MCGCVCVGGGLYTASITLSPMMCWSYVVGLGEGEEAALGVSRSFVEPKVPK